MSNEAKQGCAMMATLLCMIHYENTPMQYTEIIFVYERKKNDIFLIFAQNIDCGYMLEPPRRGRGGGGVKRVPTIYVLYQK